MRKRLIPKLKKTVYLIGPMNDDPRDSEWRDKATTALESRGFRVLNPMRGNPSVERDCNDLAEASISLAYFPYVPDRQSVGSFCEVGISHEQGNVLVVAAHDNQILDHMFIRALANARFDNLDRAISYVVKKCTKK